jgi:hypothetical protein
LLILAAPFRIRIRFPFPLPFLFPSPRNRYIMNMTDTTTGQVSDFTYDLLARQDGTESTGYFVLEHQPGSCRELPPNGNVTWTDIKVEVNGQPVASPQWKAMEEQPKCGSKATVVDPTSVVISWDSAADLEPPATATEVRES